MRNNWLCLTFLKKILSLTIQEIEELQCTYCVKNDIIPISFLYLKVIERFMFIFPNIITIL